MLILIGPAGTYVPEVGAEISEKLHLPYLYTDDAVENILGQPLSDAMIERPYQEIRHIVHTVSWALCVDLHGTDTKILALGPESMGDSVDDEVFADIRDNLMRLRNEGAHIVSLTASTRTLAHRAGLDAPHSLAFGSPRRTFMHLLNQRSALYQSLSVSEVNTEDLSVTEIVDRLLSTSI